MLEDPNTLKIGDDEYDISSLTEGDESSSDSDPVVPMGSGSSDSSDSSSSDPIDTGSGYETTGGSTDTGSGDIENS